MTDSNFILRHTLSKVYCITPTISSRIFNLYVILTVMITMCP